jgi:hypothetical protein
MGKERDVKEMLFFQLLIFISHIKKTENLKAWLGRKSAWSTTGLSRVAGWPIWSAILIQQVMAHHNSYRTGSEMQIVPFWRIVRQVGGHRLLRHKD